MRATTNVVRGATLAGLLLTLPTASACGGGERPVSSAPCYPMDANVPLTEIVDCLWQIVPALCVPTDECKPSIVETTRAVLPTKTSVYIPPKAAPPKINETPAAKPEAPRRPTITDSGSEVSPRGEDGGAGDKRFAVVFWNISGRDVLLLVSGKSHVLPRNQHITLPLGREFTWRVDQRAARTAAVPPSRNSLDILIR